MGNNLGIIVIMEKKRFCEKCKEYFMSDTTDAEAYKELTHSMWHIPGAGIGIICDDCFQEFKIWFNNLTPEDHSKILSQFKNDSPEH